VTDPLLRGSLRPDPRTLVDIFTATVRAHPSAPALDDGTTVLTYEQLEEAVRSTAATLGVAGIGPGDRVGVRVPSGTHRLYSSILGTLAAGAAYVPVDADDPQERADLVFGEAGVAAVLDSSGLTLRRTSPTQAPLATTGTTGTTGTPETADVPGLEDDAWIIFTSGSTGTPKGVAVSHRSAAAFVDAESRLFLQAAPIGPGDRVLAGLSVAFDASCEEMWLAWRNGACLVPAPRALVRSGVVDLDEPFRLQETAKRVGWAGMNHLVQSRFDVGRRRTVHRDGAEAVAFAEVQRAEPSLAQPTGVLQHGLEHRPQLSG